MEFHLLPMLTFLSLALVGSHAALSPEDYWKSVFPNTPVPKAVTEILHYSDVTMTKGIHPNGILIYAHAATEDQLHDNQNVALFFLEKNMKPGTKMNLHLTKSTNQATFLPRKVADSIPFTSKMLPEIMNRFSIKPNSVEAEIMKKTVKECEESGIEGEEKYCATSLESMVDYTKSKLGIKVQAITTEVEKETPLNKYSVVGLKKMGSDGTVVCHKQNYVYAVFYCHKTETTKAYMVSLVGADGTKVKAVAVCHTDTSAWNPEHLAFQLLKVKPGSVPICHFLLEDQIVWVAN